MYNVKHEMYDVHNDIAYNVESLFVLTDLPQIFIGGTRKNHKIVLSLVFRF